ncbi:hypothetical protein Q73_10125 [Bacillus coahuilensis m2-6]|uniref:Glutamate-rich protein GrpB n=1 Tax=Bacillus coahuilensis p1.1.43 TaxID=1150625 RepID=A0A147K718_9BACI|nr:GrpB family protein [Bacillus coahuilensis]KUP05850.1 hypothetical protein Q75_10705 [Bacillus coahuilensis p1.1.43]KUP06945.1 hypothetical protein Q73_10125 [Bacillus coahuilensis m2-6]
MKIKVAPYQTSWKSLFEDEKGRIQEALGNETLAIYHIGSTSVPGLLAKPVIDIMPVVDDISRVDLYEKQMNELGYEALGEFGIKGRRYFRKGWNVRTHHVHVFESRNTHDINRHLAVREYLRNHKQAARQYGELKEALVQRYQGDQEAYINGKDLFVKDLERKAMEWYKGDKQSFS